MQTAHVTSYLCLLAMPSSVQQGTMRDNGLPLPEQEGRLRLGSHPSHAHSLLETPEAAVRCLRQLLAKVRQLCALYNTLLVRRRLCAPFFSLSPELAENGTRPENERPRVCSLYPEREIQYYPS